MQKFNIKYNQILFLYAYLRHINLSLDRSRWTSWNEFQVYFKDRLQPIQIIEYLKRNFNLPNTDLEQFVFFFKKKPFIVKLKSVIRKDKILSQHEILYCCKLLWIFEKELESNIEEYNLEIEKLRIDVSQFYNEVLGLLISNKDLNRLMKIEHYNQSNEIEVIEMSEFIPDDFWIK